MIWYEMHVTCDVCTTAVDNGDADYRNHPDAVAARSTAHSNGWKRLLGTDFGIDASRVNGAHGNFPKYIDVCPDCARKAKG